MQVDYLFIFFLEEGGVDLDHRAIIGFYLSLERFGRTKIARFIYKFIRLIILLLQDVFNFDLIYNSDECHFTNMLLQKGA